MFIGGIFNRIFGGATSVLTNIARYNTQTDTWSPLANKGLNGYSPVTIKNVIGTGSMLVRANQGAYSNPANGLPANRLSRWWQIENPGGIINSDLHFGYLQTDIAGNENSSKVYRIAGGAATMLNSTVNTFSNITSAQGVTGSSDWTLAESAPTAASVSVGGQVLAFKGRDGISGALIFLMNANGETRYAVINPFGFYAFADVPAGETYIISVSHKRYRFASSPRVQLIGEDMNDFNFMTLP